MFATLLLLGGGIVAFALTPWLWLALPLLFVAGFGYLASNTHATSRLQLGVEAVGAREDHGALERRVPRPAPVREHHRRG